MVRLETFVGVGECVALVEDEKFMEISRPGSPMADDEDRRGADGDGFGLGWYGEHPEPGLYREVRPAWSDENLRYLCRHIRSHLYFAHVRAATGTPVACGRLP